jgi:hypothetical protein
MALEILVSERFSAAPLHGKRRRTGAEIIKSGCSLESTEFSAFYSATIYSPNTRREFFNRIDCHEPVAPRPALNEYSRVESAYSPLIATLATQNDRPKTCLTGGRLRSVLCLVPAIHPRW